MVRNLMIYLAIGLATLSLAGHGVKCTQMYSFDGLGSMSVLTSVCIMLLAMARLIPSLVRAYFCMPVLTVGFLRTWAYLSGADQSMVSASSLEPAKMTSVTAVMLMTAALSMVWRRGCVVLNSFVIVLAVIAILNHFGTVLKPFFSGTTINTGLALVCISVVNLMACPYDVKEEELLSENKV